MGFYNWLDALITATAWKMIKPPSYGWFHILFTLIGFVICGIAAWKLRKASEKTNKIILIGCGAFLMICEVYKQLFYYFYLSSNRYDWGIFPFHLCSVPMYLCLIAPLLKPGKVQKGMYSFMMIYNLLSGAISFTEPSGLLHDYWTLTLHAMIWHMMIVFVGLFLYLSNRGGHTIKDYKNATVTLLCLCALAFCINLIFRDVSNGSINMFFVGPSNSSIIVFKQISEMFGWYYSTALYIPALCLGGYLVFLPKYLINKKKALKTTV